MVNNFVSVKRVIEKIYRDYKSQIEIPEEDIVEWVGEALDLIGAAPQYYVYCKRVDIENHRGLLPCDLKSIYGIIYNNAPMEPSTAIIQLTSVNSNEDIEDLKLKYPQIRGNAMTYKADYTIQAPYIITSFEEGCVEVIFTSTPLDDDGYPMIPDDAAYMEACTVWCQSKLDRLLWRAGKLPEAVYRDTENKWDRFAGSARARAHMPNYDKAEAFGKQWTRLIPLRQSWKSMFQYLGAHEARRLK